MQDTPFKLLFLPDNDPEELNLRISISVFDFIFLIFILLAYTNYAQGEPLHCTFVFEKRNALFDHFHKK